MNMQDFSCYVSAVQRKIPNANVAGYFFWPRLDFTRVYRNILLIQYIDIDILYIMGISWEYHGNIYIPYAPWCRYIYLQNWMIFRANVSKYSIHGAYGYLYTVYLAQHAHACDHQEKSTQWVQLTGFIEDSICLFRYLLGENHGNTAPRRWAYLLVGYPNS